MRHTSTYRQTFRISETFPVEINETWTVAERGMVCERWRVVDKTKTSFTAEIISFFPRGGSPSHV